MSVPTGEGREQEIKKLRAKRDKEAQAAADQLDLSMLHGNDSNASGNGNSGTSLKELGLMFNYAGERLFGNQKRADILGDILGYGSPYDTAPVFRQPWQAAGEKARPLSTTFRTSSAHIYQPDTGYKPSGGIIDLKTVLKNDGPQMLRPEVLTAIELRPEIASKVAFMLKIASENPEIDGVMWVNQMWQESGLNEKAVGTLTKYGQARGAAQFMPETGAHYGLLTAADFFDFEKSMRASLAHMTVLKKTFNNDQSLAMAAYNGGARAVTHLYDKYGKDITLAEWVGDMDEKNARYGTGGRNLWRNQTLEYVKLADSRFWDAQKIEKSKTMTAKILGQDNIAVSALKSNGSDITVPAPQTAPAPQPLETPEQQPAPPPPAG